MSVIPARLLGSVAAAALVIAPVASASPAGAATRASHRQTTAMELAADVGDAAGMFSQEGKIDGRSTRSLRGAMELAKVINAAMGFELMRITGLTDRNHDGLDDDAKVTVRAFDNVAILRLHKDRTYSVSDGGFVFSNRRSVLKESAQSFDRILRLAASTGIDSWDMHLIGELQSEMPTGVRVVSDHDGNHDGYDDDGRLTFLGGGKAVTLTIGNTSKAVGKVSYGPTWKTKAPKRTHHPVAPPYLGSIAHP